MLFNPKKYASDYPCEKSKEIMRKTIDFLLNDWLDVASLAAHERYSEHSRETFESVLDTCQRRNPGSRTGPSSCRNAPTTRRVLTSSRE